MLEIIKTRINGITLFFLSLLILVKPFNIEIELENNNNNQMNNFGNLMDLGKMAGNPFLENLSKIMLGRNN